ncbi:MAG: LysR family transcriptional regulator [Clostridiales bacterium]|nr:LysR family transcriptional regulator [Clostridiales bacterium]
MSLDKLDYVLALAEERNLTRAARKAFISQPTLTNYINRLEEQLGVKLFDRSVTPIEITRAGALYIEQMKKIQLAETNLRNELRILGSMETVFHLGIGATRGNHWLPLLLPEFCRRHPEMGIQLHEQGEEFLEDGVRQGEIDLAIGVLDTGYPELCYEKLAEEPVLLAIPRSYACVRDLPMTEATPARPYAIPPAQVNGLPFLLPYPGNGSYRSSKLLLHEAGVRPGRILGYSNMSTARQLCALGLGALFVTGALFERTLPGGQERIAFCTLQQPVYTRTSVAAYRPENPRAALCREAIALTRELVLPRLELPV